MVILLLNLVVGYCCCMLALGYLLQHKYENNFSHNPIIEKIAIFKRLILKISERKKNKKTNRKARFFYKG